MSKLAILVKARGNCPNFKKNSAFQAKAYALILGRIENPVQKRNVQLDISFDPAGFLLFRGRVFTGDHEPGR